MSARDITAIDLERAEALDDLLSRWASWQGRVTVGSGYKSGGCFSQYRSSRQYDDGNGALDEDIERSTCKTVDHQVSLLEDPYRSAIYIEGRRLRTGCSAFVSPRLNGLDVALITQQAREMLTKRLISCGVMA